MKLSDSPVEFEVCQHLLVYDAVIALLTPTGASIWKERPRIKSSLFNRGVFAAICWHLWCFQVDTLQWTGNSEDSDKATAAQAGGEKKSCAHNKYKRRGEVIFHRSELAEAVNTLLLRLRTQSDPATSVSLMPLPRLTSLKSNSLCETISQCTRNQLDCMPTRR
ncbi:hypothetical protein INR49_010729 [Caranx melampygus]|nr:hypothetical protein INR49_010729 [Caranx melampygus]